MNINKTLTISGKNSKGIPFERSIEIHGTISDAKYIPVVDTFCENWAKFKEIGSSTAAFLNGELVFELYGGLKDIKSKTKWEKDTLINVYSVTKAIANFCILILIQRKMISFETPVCNIWPEFGAQGKEDITIAQLLSHQAGLCHFDFDFDISELLEIQENEKKREEFIQKIANEKPKWNIRQDHRSGYHALSVGFYVSEIVRRVDPKKRSVSQFFQEEIAQPLGIEFYMGLDKNQVKVTEPRVSRIYASPSNPGSDQNSGLKNPTLMTIKTFQLISGFSPYKARNCEVASAIGLSTAVSIARIFSILTDGKDPITHQQILSSDLVSRSSKVFIEGDDQVLLRNIGFTEAGFMKEHSNERKVKYSSTFFHGGLGGSVGMGIPELGLSFSYVTNALDMVSTTGDPRREAILESVIKCVEMQNPQSKL